MEKKNVLYNVNQQENIKKEYMKFNNNKQFMTLLLFYL